MKIKTRLRLGFAFLFVIVICFGGFALYYIQEISNSAKVILKDNYETLNYTKEMRAVLDEDALPLSTASIARFNDQLVKQEHNITEVGEGAATASVRANFELLKKTGSDPQRLEAAIRRQLRNIETMNMDAIVRKNTAAMTSVKNATIYLSLVGTLTFLILFSFSVNFPGFIANPLRELLEGIREISEKNYSQRLNFEKDDEFGELATAFNQMAERLKDWENSNLSKIKSEKLRIETIIEQMQDAIIGINEKGQILFINNVAESIFNLDKTKITGVAIDELAKTNDLIKNSITNTTSDKPLKIYANDKESFFQVESREIIVPNISPNKEDELQRASISAGRVIVLRNITEFKELDEAKTNFIATISHELKTPMSSIKMSISLLNDERIGGLNKEQQNLVLNIKDDCDRLLRITSELLDLSQAETGNLKLNIAATDPLKIVEYAISSVKFQAEQKEVALEVIASPALPSIQVDVEKIAWVLVNLLSNALRYSAERSKIFINVSRVGNDVVFAVRDSGKGIDKQYQKRLFDRYFRVPTDGSTRTGTGLGLAISKDFIEAQNGKIWVESAIGEGSTFSFALPVVG